MVNGRQLRTPPIKTLLVCGAVFGLAIVVLLKTLDNNGNNIETLETSFLDSIFLARNSNSTALFAPPNPALLKNLSSTNGFESAEKFYALFGYRKCRALSERQKTAKFWMHLRGPAGFICSQFFEDSVINGKTEVQWPPPKKIPESLRDLYLLYGRVDSSSYYFAQRYDGKPEPLNWTQKLLDDHIAKAKNKDRFSTYGADTDQLYEVLKWFNLSAKKGMVIGSETPWVEAIVLAHGNASEVLTVEYAPIVSSHPRVFYVHPFNLSANWETWESKAYDFAFTYSSLEHTGLGRYGDRLDPFGDIKEMLKLSCLLRDGALVFLGLPMGKDHIAWNAHRIYGWWRLPLMTANFEVLGLYINSRVENPFKFLSASRYQHAIIVLRNVKKPLC